MPKMNQMKEVGVALRKIEPPSSLRINLSKNKIDPSKLKLGNKMKMVIEGKITSINQNEYEKSCNLDLSKCECMEESNDSEEE